MTNRFLISAAIAALIAGTGLASAQGMNRENGAPGGAGVQQGAPTTERGAAPGTVNRDSAGSAGIKGSDSGIKAETKEKLPAGKSAQDTTKTPGAKSKSMSSEMQDNAKDSSKGDGKDMKAEGAKPTGNMKAETKGTTTDSKSQITTGNAATSAIAAPPAEKRTQIVSAIKSERIEETTNVNFNIAVGATVPATVRFHPVPLRIVEIYPEWRGYEVVFVHGRYIIVRPRTHEIVYIIEG